MPNRRLPDGDTEGFGLVFLEANACGLPVIAGRDGGSTDAVRHGENGLVVDGTSVADIAAAMRLLREDAALRRQLAPRRDEGRSHVRLGGKDRCILAALLSTVTFQDSRYGFARRHHSLLQLRTLPAGLYRQSARAVCRRSPHPHYRRRLD